MVDYGGSAPYYYYKKKKTPTEGTTSTPDASKIDWTFGAFTQEKMMKDSEEQRKQFQQWMDKVAKMGQKEPNK
jgi:hypothetical protein